MLRFALAGGFAAFLTLAGCGGAVCTLAYHPGGLVVEVSAEALAPGVYTFELGDDRVRGRCVLTLPAVDAAEQSCTGNLRVTLSDDGADISSLSAWDFAPETVFVRVLLDEEELAYEGFAPDYEIDEPNGEGCGERRRGRVTLAL